MEETFWISFSSRTATPDKRRCDNPHLFHRLIYTTEDIGEQINLLEGKLPERNEFTFIYRERVTGI